MVGATAAAYRMQTGVDNVRATTTVKSGYSANGVDIGTHSAISILARWSSRGDVFLNALRFSATLGNNVAWECCTLSINLYSRNSFFIKKLLLQKQFNIENFIANKIINSDIYELNGTN